MVITDFYGNVNKIIKKNWRIRKRKIYGFQIWLSWQK